MIALSKPTDTEKTDRALADVYKLENVALRAARRVVGRLRQEALRAYRARISKQGGGDFSSAVIIKELHPILSKAAAISHIAGSRRSVLLTRQSVTVNERRNKLKFDLLDNVSKLLKKVLKVDVKKVEESYNAVSLRALSNLAVPIQQKVQSKINDLINRGSLLKDAIEEIDDTLTKLGVSSVSESKLETVFRTQLQTSFNAGRWQADQDPDIQEILWGYKYVTVGDDRVREDHAELEGVTLPKDDPFWQTYWPPNGWNCRCQVIPIFEERDIVQPGLLEDGSMPQPDEGFGYNPGVVLADATTKADFKLSWDEADHPRGADGKFGEGGGIERAERKLAEAAKGPSLKGPGTPWEDARSVSSLGLKFDDGDGLIDNLSKESEHKIQNTKEVREFDISELEATQDVARLNKVRDAIKRDSTKDVQYGMPVVAKFEDKLYVMDGTHRVIADGLLGRKTKVLFADLDEDIGMGYGIEFSSRHEFSTTQVNLPDDLTKQVRKMAAQIDDEDLVDKGREDELHITIKYGLHTDDAGEVQKALGNFGSLAFTLGKTSIFETEKYDVVKIDVLSVSAWDLNKRLSSKLEHTTTQSSYVPHATLAYVKKGAGKKYIGMDDVVGKNFTVKDISFRNRDGKRKKLALLSRV